ncbi:MAG: (2Fe-2S)-binding protein [Steroidobacteraceae bacterium]
MYVCICHGITDKEIRQAVERGASSLPEVQRSLPVAGCCGRCEATARDVVDECLRTARRSDRPESSHAWSGAAEPAPC